MLSPIKLSSPKTNPDDRRLGHWLSASSSKDSVESGHIILVGFPSQEGVYRNGGRLGAELAPAEVRRSLYKLTPHPAYIETWSPLLAKIRDVGDVHITGDVEQDQQTLGRLVGSWLRAGAIPVMIGGGHETAYGHFLGYVEADMPINIVNIDAHADVRPLKEGLAHSGSPFRQALSHASDICRHYSVLGLSPWSVAKSHLDYLRTNKCNYHWASEINISFLDHFFDDLHAPTMVTLDMDVVEQQAAPGVSAPCSGGIPLSVFYHAAYLAGKSPWVRSLDLVEINPSVDIDSQTARAGATTVWYFLQGLVERGQLPDQA